jgi:hypothetical protein
MSGTRNARQGLDLSVPSKAELPNLSRSATGTRLRHGPAHDHPGASSLRVGGDRETRAERTKAAG